MANELSLEKLKSYDYYITVGDLLDFIEKNNIPRDAKVLYQRIEDFYFENKNGRDGWDVVLKDGESYHSGVNWNNDLETGKYEDKEQYPNAKPESWKKHTEEELLSMKDQYIPVFSPVKFHDDDNLYLTAHY